MKIFILKLVPQKHQEKKEADWKKDFCSALKWKIMFVLLHAKYIRRI